MYAIRSYYAILRLRLPFRFNDVELRIGQPIRAVEISHQGGEFDLLAMGHGGAGRLLAVTQGGVENADLVRLGHGRLPGIWGNIGKGWLVFP